MQCQTNLLKNMVAEDGSSQGESILLLNKSMNENSSKCRNKIGFIVMWIIYIITLYYIFNRLLDIWTHIGIGTKNSPLTFSCPFDQTLFFVTCGQQFYAK